jgi:hypothetical protein
MNFVFEQFTAAQNCTIICYYALRGIVIPAKVGNHATGFADCRFDLVSRFNSSGMPEMSI